MKAYVKPSLSFEYYIPNQTIAASSGPAIGQTVTIPTGETRWDGQEITVTITFMGYRANRDYGTFVSSPDLVTDGSPIAVYNFSRSDWSDYAGNVALDGYNGSPLDGVLDSMDGGSLPGGMNTILAIQKAFGAYYLS